MAHHNDDDDDDDDNDNDDGLFTNSSFWKFQKQKTILKSDFCCSNKTDKLLQRTK